MLLKLPLYVGALHPLKILYTHRLYCTILYFSCTHTERDPPTHCLPVQGPKLEPHYPTPLSRVERSKGTLRGGVGAKGGGD